MLSWHCKHYGMGNSRLHSSLRQGQARLWHRCSIRISCSSCHVAFISPSFGPLKVRHLVWAKYHSFLHNRKETVELTQRARHLLQGELPWEDLIIRSLLTISRVSKTRQDWNLVFRQWKSKEREDCVLLYIFTSVFFQTSTFRKVDSNGKSLMTLKRSPWCLAQYRPWPLNVTSLQMQLPPSSSHCNLHILHALLNFITNLHSLTIQ